MKRPPRPRPWLLAPWLLAWGCTEPPQAPTLLEAKGKPDARPVVIASRTEHLESYPCAECHAEREPEPVPRKLVELHSGIELDHGDNHPWCDRCHVLEAPERLVLLDGRTQVGFDQVHRLCGQCHVSQLRDFEDGIHGSQAGSNPERILRRACTACHDPHAPGPITLQAMPKPAPPRNRHE